MTMADLSPRGRRVLQRLSAFAVEAGLPAPVDRWLATLPEAEQRTVLITWGRQYVIRAAARQATMEATAARHATREDLPVPPALSARFVQITAALTRVRATLAKAEEP
jgi:hypothetical protein